MPIKKALETIIREELFKRGDKVLVAFSGGADSACLLHMLNSLRHELGIEIYSAHLNHQIRGAAAHEDALFSYRESKALGIPCFLQSTDVPLEAKEGRLTIEEAAREVRYKMFFDLKEKLGIDKIAVAHNLDDQAETLIMRIMRGTGLNGLKGMEYKRPDGLIRPLLDLKRYEIEEYCNINKINYRTDETNFENSYTRNKIRLELFPFIEDHFACNIKEMLSRMANGLREDSKYLEDIAQEVFWEIAHEIEDYAVKFELDHLETLSASIIKRVFRLAYTKLSGTGDGIEAIHLDDALRLLRNTKSNLMINFPKGIIAEKKGYNFYITKKPIEIENIDFEYKILLDGVTEIPELGIAVESQIMSKEKCKLLSSSNNIKAFDLDKISGTLVVRNRHIGDRIKPLGFSGTKKLKDIFIDKKIPQSERNRIPIFADDEKVVWIFGHMISEESKISEETEKVARLTVKPIENDLYQEEK